jgi:glycine/D-amino acid oxidase-like deaminating enzyme
MWDTEVDLVCIGAGIGGLASAIAAVDAGADVIVADAVPERGGDASSVATRRRIGSLRGWLPHETVDVDTNEYFAALTEGLDPLAHRGDATRVPTRVASEWMPDARSVEPFFGTAIRAWDAQCLGSPFGLLSSIVVGVNHPTMRSSDGESIAVMPLGEMNWQAGIGEHELLGWLAAQAHERDVEVLAASRLQRLVFEEALIVGVVLDTPDGPFAVRTHHGVTLSPPEHDQAPSAGLTDPSSDDRRQVCLVGRTASRFARVELITTVEPPVVDRPVCSASGRQLRGHLRESRQVPSDAWRYRKVHGHPPLGQ